MLTRAILYLPLLAAAGLLAVLILGGSAKGALGIGLPLVSAAALLPIQLGCVIGHAVRRRIRPELFPIAVLCVLAYGGIDVLRRALF